MSWTFLPEILIEWKILPGYRITPDMTSNNFRNTAHTISSDYHNIKCCTSFWLNYCRIICIIAREQQSTTQYRIHSAINNYKTPPNFICAYRMTKYSSIQLINSASGLMKIFTFFNCNFHWRCGWFFIATDNPIAVKEDPWSFIEAFICRHQIKPGAGVSR